MNKEAVLRFADRLWKGARVPDGTSVTIHSTPVGPAVTYFACHSESLVPEFPALNLYIEDSCYSTHNCNCFKGFMFL